MPFFDNYPYTNFHNVNLDWVLQAVKSWGALVEQNNQNFINLTEAYTAFRDWLTNDYNEFKEYVTDYLDNLDVQEEINNKLDDMMRSGELAPYLQPYISTTVSNWLDSHITPTTPALDTSLTVAGAAADAKAAGDAISAVDAKTIIENFRRLTLARGSLDSRYGSELSPNASPGFCRTVEMLDVFSFAFSFMYTGPDTYTYQGSDFPLYVFVYEYAGPESNAQCFVRRRNLRSGDVYTRSEDALYIRITIGCTNASGVTMTTSEAYKLFQFIQLKSLINTELLIDKISWRMSTMLARVRQMASAGYTPLAKIPNQSTDMVRNHYYHGLPYSSVRALDTFIGQDISIHTFFSLLHNPRSVIYTRMSTNTNSKTYVGTVCSAFVDYCFGLDFAITVRMMHNNPDYAITDFYNIEMGDICLNDQHGILITRVNKDKYGRPVNIEFAQAAPPRVSYDIMTPAALKAFIDTNNYDIFRFNGLSDNPYEPCQYVKGYPDEILDETYPDIMSEFGDKSVIKEGENVTINVLNNVGYESIEIWKDGALLQTKTEIEDFTINNIAAGTWTIKMSGAEIATETSFIAVNMTCSFDSNTNIVSFASSNATPIGVNTFGSDGGMQGLRRLTATDLTKGYVDITSLMTNNWNVRVVFKTPWGKASWRSVDLHLWQPFSG